MSELGGVTRLSWDVARCTGENQSEKCTERMNCLRHTEFEGGSLITPKFEAPVDAPLSTGCELMIHEQTR